MLDELKHFTKVEVEVYECDECGNQFLSVDEAAEHWDIDHDEDEENKEN